MLSMRGSRKYITPWRWAIPNLLLVSLYSPNVPTSSSPCASRLLARKSPDVTLFGSDVPYVPDNKGKRLGVGVLDRIAQFGTNSATRVMVPPVNCQGDSPG